MRLYALYNRSKRVIFVVVLGFIIENAIMFVVDIFSGQSLIAGDIQWKLIALLDALKPLAMN